MKRSYSRISYFIIDWIGVFIGLSIVVVGYYQQDAGFISKVVIGVGFLFACICGVLLTQLKADNDDENSIAKKLLSFKKKKGTKK